MEIQSKIKAVDNVIDMLTGIIGDTRPTLPLDIKIDENNLAGGRESSKEKHSSRSISKEKVLEKKKSDKVTIETKSSSKFYIKKLIIDFSEVKGFFNESR